MKMNEIGTYVFYLGFLVALVSPFVAIPSVGFILLILGLIVGLLNISEKETHNFLLATVALLLTSSVGWEVLETVGPIVSNFLGNLSVLVGPAALVVALKSIWSMAKN